MGMSTYVVGFIPPDERWLRMKAVWEACRAAHIDPPAEVERLFEDGPPDDSGREVTMHEGVHPAVKEWTDGDMRQGIEVDLSQLPAGMTSIRFINSY